MVLRDGDRWYIPIAILVYVVGAILPCAGLFAEFGREDGPPSTRFRQS